jgi:hypothetical protein
MPEHVATATVGRPPSQRVLPLVRRLSALLTAVLLRLPLTPNHVTVAAFHGDARATMPDPAPVSSERTIGYGPRVHRRGAR